MGSPVSVVVANIVMEHIEDSLPQAGMTAVTPRTVCQPVIGLFNRLTDSNKYICWVESITCGEQ